MEVQLDMYQTLAASVLVLMLGSYLKQKYMFWKNSVSRHRLSGTVVCNRHLHLLQQRNYGDFF